MTPELAERIRQRLAEYLAGSAPDPLDLRSVVAKFGALPLTLDMAGCLATLDVTSAEQRAAALQQSDDAKKKRLWRL
jgi:hypothetical protein